MKAERNLFLVQPLKKPSYDSQYNMRGYPSPNPSAPSPQPSPPLPPTFGTLPLEEISALSFSSSECGMSWFRRLSSCAIRLQKRRLRIPGGPAVHLTRYPPPARRIRTPSGPGVYLRALSASRKGLSESRVVEAFISLAIRRQGGVSGPRGVQAFIFTRYPPPRRRTPTPRVQPFLFTRYPLPGRCMRTPSGPGVHLHSLSAAGKAYPDPEWSSRSSSLAIRRQKGVA